MRFASVSACFSVASSFRRHPMAPPSRFDPTGKYRASNASVGLFLLRPAVFLALLLLFLLYATRSSPRSTPADLPYPVLTQLTPKLFQMALRPLQIKPAWHRAAVDPKPGQLGICTFADVSHLEQLRGEIFESYASLAIHVMPGNLTAELAIVRKWLAGSPAPKFADIHLVITPHARQLNLLRNVARLFSRADIVLSLDGGFVQSANLDAILDAPAPKLKARMQTKDASTWRRALLTSETALIIPSFDLLPSSDIPRTKSALLALWPEPRQREGEPEWMDHMDCTSDICPFYHRPKGYPPAYLLTHYGKLRRAKEPYCIDENFDAYSGEEPAKAFNFEPFVIHRRDGYAKEELGIPYADERLIGWGSNKAASVYEMHTAGVSFWVSTLDAFLVHMGHEKERVERTTNTGKNSDEDARLEAEYSARGWAPHRVRETNFNSRDMYPRLRRELCFRYRRMQGGKVDELVHGNGSWRAPLPASCLVGGWGVQGPCD